MGTKYKLGVVNSLCVGFFLCMGSSFTASSKVAAHSVAQPFVSQPVSLPGTYSSLHLKHQDRSYSGGFSALWMSDDCSQLITISDYSQIKAKSQDVPVRRSG